jgi:uncharacterized protein YfeS
MRKFIVALLFLSQTLLGTSSAYFKTMTHKEGIEALALHREVKQKSKKLQLLDCPLALIERQWQGLESVLIGTQYLREFIAESNKHQPNYQSIYFDCLNTLEEYQSRDRQGLVKARDLGMSEIEELKLKFNQQSAIEEQRLLKLVLSGLNAETLCYSQRVSVNAAFFLGLSAGTSYMECYTPLGRRFMLLGPSIGVGAGISTSMILPNSGYHNQLAHSFLLFRRSERDLWTMRSTSTSMSSILGINVQRDPSKCSIPTQRSRIYKHDLRATIGFGCYHGREYQVMARSTLSPLYIKLVESGLFSKMAK